MYNRYIPQPDGSYRRNRIEDRKIPERPHPQEPVQEEAVPAAIPCEEPIPKEEPRKSPPLSRRNTGAGDFLRQLLPKNLDTGDLLVILLLLLMAGDCAEDQNTALLTLALYLFL